MDRVSTTTLGPLAKRRRGVSLLLEIVIGLGIFAGAILLALGVVSFSERATVGARNRSVALNLARAALDSELSKSFASVESSSGSIVVVGERAGVKSPIPFTMSILVTDLGSDQKHVVCEVSWRETNMVRKVNVEGFATNV